MTDAPMQRIDVDRELGGIVYAATGRFVRFTDAQAAIKAARRQALDDFIAALDEVMNRPSEELLDAKIKASIDDLTGPDDGCPNMFALYKRTIRAMMENDDA